MKQVTTKKELLNRLFESIDDVTLILREVIERLDKNDDTMLECAMLRGAYCSIKCLNHEEVTIDLLEEENKL